MNPTVTIGIVCKKRLYQRSIKNRISREDLNLLLAFTVERLKERLNSYYITKWTWQQWNRKLPMPDIRLFTISKLTR
ncbi:hypothetical protein Pmani_015052 [Petrolisthes manimaculis]|uniref:Uncharacterized protein n=1 Tax=Petrolisthes manimaculis TaxID=1843537 RepID=A0AAE1PV75_9EUCA|nr:hypothetical protein Pmani_015052 [Petrolisthes manimaculis]